jgi:DNA polymerase-4
VVIAHIDLDAFFAAVELHHHPELRGQPLVVGGDPNGRGVVATASYAAREFGIRSAMSSAEARRRCPDAVFLRPNMSAYREWSTRLWDMVEPECEVFEQAGIDEAYLELNDKDPLEHAQQIQQLVREKMRLSCSLGVSAAKVVAKIASDFDKPGGITYVPPGEEAAFLAPMAARKLPGVGPRTEERLTKVGISTIGQLAAMDDDHPLLRGKWGAVMALRARGIDRRTVGSERAERISISTERTFEEDLSDRAQLSERGREMAGRVAERLTEKGRYARTVTVKMRYPDFTTITRAQTLNHATDDAIIIWRAAAMLIGAALRVRNEPLRLLGIGVTGLSDQRQLTLFSLEGLIQAKASPKHEVAS